MPSLQISIRQYRVSDIDALHRVVEDSKEALSLWMPWYHREYSRKDTENWVKSRDKAWRENKEWSFLIVDQSDTILGACGLHRIDVVNGIAELGYWVKSTETNKGVASEATRQIARWAFEATSLFRLEILISIENIASQRAAEKAGARKEATLKKRCHLNNQRHDCTLYVMLKDEFSL